MSRSEKQHTQNNPARRFFRWKAQLGQLTWYDKEKEQRQVVPLPFSFLVVNEDLMQIGGGKRVRDEFVRYRSNAIYSNRKEEDEITVRTFDDEVVGRGLYKDIKETKGFRYEKPLYIAYYNDDKNLELGCIILSGASWTAFLNFWREIGDVSKGVVILQGKSKPIEGQVTYYAPVFVHSPKVSEEADRRAIEMDQELRAYLAEYFRVDHGGDGDDDDEAAVEDKAIEDKAVAVKKPAAVPSPRARNSPSQSIASKNRKEEAPWDATEPIDDDDDGEYDDDIPF